MMEKNGIKIKKQHSKEYHLPQIRLYPLEFKKTRGINMENYKNCNEEVSIKLVGKLTLLLEILQNDLPLQIEVKKLIDETLYDYDVTTKCTSLSTSDIKEKARLYIA